MIAYLKGTILSKSVNYLVLQTGGVGYKVMVSANFLLVSKIGQEVELFIHSYIREDQISLYGFLSRNELELFELLISVSGIGPKMALGILSSTTPERIKSAIASGESVMFTKVSGIGRKTAERLIMELKEKIGDDISKIDTGSSKEISESLDALVALGYSKQEARDAVKKVSQELETSEQIIKVALRILGGR